MTDFGPLGKNPEQRLLEDGEALRAAADALLEQARLSVRIHAPALDPAVLDREEPIAALARLTRQRRARIRVLFHDAHGAIRQGHRLIDLARRFPSYVELRKISEEDREREDAWMVADDSGLVYRPEAARLAAAHTCFHDLGMAPKLARDFDDWWERASPDPELRQLFI